MNNIFIKKEQLNEIVSKHFKGDLISIEELIDTIEDLDFEIECLEERIDNLKSHEIARQMGGSIEDVV